MSEDRDKKLHVLVGRLNKERKDQARKIDILCNDIISAQRNFVKKLAHINFVTDFYESIIGKTNLSGILHTAGTFIKDEFPDANVAFFLRKKIDFEMHLFESGKNDMTEKHLEHHFTSELVENICDSNKLCTTNELLAMGLQCSPNQLIDISAVTIPLSNTGPATGFILIYMSSESELSHDKLNHVYGIIRGLSQAIESCRLAPV